MDVSETWTIAQRTARAQAEVMARQLGADFAPLVLAQATRFTTQSSPESKSELARRQSQHLALSSRIGAVAHADTMSRLHPNVAETILARTRSLTASELPGNEGELRAMHTETLAFANAISALCHEATLDRITGSFADEPEFDEVVRLGRQAANVRVGTDA
jgi:hypothetical protein